MQPFTPGQVWTYNTRPGEESSRIVICRVEADVHLGEIVHIQVIGLRFKNRHTPTGIANQIGHMPYAGKSLRACLKTVESISDVPSFEDGYQEWLTAFDASKAGVWTAPVSEAIAGLESALNQ